MKQPHAVVPLVLAALLAVPLTGCGEQGDPETHRPDPASGTRAGPVDADRPPPVTLLLPDGAVDLEPWTYCWSTTCVDGSPGEDLPEAGAPSVVDFAFPEKGWEFTATFSEHDVEACPRRIDVPVVASGDGRWRLEPAGPAGTWDVELFGRGDGGDVATSFTWTTPAAGSLPEEAGGSAAVLADHDGELDSYGVEVAVSDLARHPARASATVTVTGASGRSVTIPTRPQRDCTAAGSLWFTAPESAGRRAAEIGPGPLRYTVELVLDGATYTGRGSWPSGVDPEVAPHVPLRWTPALPVYAG